MTSPLADTPVIVLNWNGWDDSFECLESVYRARPTAHVWLVDNGSIEDRSAELKRRFPECTYIALDENFGWAGGYNRALRIVEQRSLPYAYLLNNDTTVERGFLSDALAVAEGDPQIAAVGSTILFGEGDFVRFDGEYHRFGEKAATADGAAEPVDCARTNGAGMLIRIEAFSETGPFDERFFCYYEETDWCRRATHAGRRIVLSPRSVIHHKCRGSDESHNRLYYLCRNRFIRTSVTTPDIEALSRRARRDARQQWREHRDPKAVFAILAGLRDGLAGRFGERRVSPFDIGLLFRLAYRWMKRGRRVDRIGKRPGVAAPLDRRDVVPR